MYGDRLYCKRCGMASFDINKARDTRKDTTYKPQCPNCHGWSMINAEIRLIQLESMILQIKRHDANSNMKVNKLYDVDKKLIYHERYNIIKALTKLDNKPMSKLARVKVI